MATPLSCESDTSDGNVADSGGIERDSDVVTMPEQYPLDVLWYDMGYGNGARMRRKCVIFNFWKFAGGDERKGTEKDKERIRKVFGEKLGFDVDVHENLEKEAMLETLKKLAGEDHSRSCCLCLFVLSHGRDDIICCSDNQQIQLSDVYGQFDPTNCKGLTNKPKLFFIQACRGGEKDTGVQYDGTVDSDAWSFTRTVPRYADFFVFYATCPAEQDIPVSSAEVHKQMPNINSTLRKSLLFAAPAAKVTATQPSSAAQKCEHALARTTIKVRPTSPCIEYHEGRNLKISSPTEVIWRPQGVNKLLEMQPEQDSYRTESPHFLMMGYRFKLVLTIRIVLGLPFLAVVLFLCPGPYDNDLTWPFNTPHTVTLMHKVMDTFNVQVKSNFPDSIVSSHQKPQPECYKGRVYRLIHLNPFTIDDFTHGNALRLSLKFYPAN
ncbi:uncharacterized protein LOC135378895 isoform X2 [Ornithodoros turicata]|uniref:uncharacterized protein LOC135378895 isoform X2 n=1 Tax=Ornithodoros turicata TaxID=34597 RepID=UPI0031391704